MNGTNRMKLLCGSLVCLTLSLFGVLSLPAAAQVVAKPPVTTPSAGGNSFDGPGDVRYQADRDVQDRRIDMFMGDWRDSMPRHAFGSLVLRDILTRGDNFAPTAAGRYPPGRQLPRLRPVFSRAIPPRLRGWSMNRSSTTLSAARER